MSKVETAISIGYVSYGLGMLGALVWVAILLVQVLRRRSQGKNAEDLGELDESLFQRKDSKTILIHLIVGAFLLGLTSLIAALILAILS